jgi:hypothetical protein
LFAIWGAEGFIKAKPVLDARTTKRLVSEERRFIKIPINGR